MEDVETGKMFMAILLAFTGYNLLLLLSECVTYLMLKVNDLYFCMDK